MYPPEEICIREIHWIAECDSGESQVVPEDEAGESVIASLELLPDDFLELSFLFVGAVSAVADSIVQRRGCYRKGIGRFFSIHGVVGLRLPEIRSLRNGV